MSDSDSAHILAQRNRVWAARQTMARLGLTETLAELDAEYRRINLEWWAARQREEAARYQGHNGSNK